MHKMLSIVVAILFFSLPPSFALLPPYTEYSQLDLPSKDVGPDSVALDPSGGGPYADSGDGRILKYNGTQFVDFTYTSPKRTKEECDGLTNAIDLGEKCGTHLGFSFDPKTRDLYIVDIYGGLYRVGSDGGQATLLANNASGVPFKLLSGLDFDSIRGLAYFTDVTLHYTPKDVLQGNPTPPNDSSGRLLEYNTKTGEVRVLQEGLPAPVGPAVSRSGKHVLFSSYLDHQIYKYTVDEPNERAQPLLTNLPGTPIKVKRAPTTLLEADAFWVPVNVVVQAEPRIVDPLGYKFTINGEVLVKKNLTDQYPKTQVDSLQEYRFLLKKSELYVGSLNATYVGIYKSWL